MNIPVAVLAGGLATRLRPLTETIPKALLDVGGEPFIAHQLRLFKRQGIEQVVLCVGHLGDQVKAFVQDGSAFGVQVTYSFDGDQLLGTGGALQKAAPLLGDLFWVTYGDSYLDIPFAPIQAFFEKQERLALMALCENAGRWDKSNILFNKGRICEYDKTTDNPAFRHIDFGLLLFRKQALEVIPPGQKMDLSVALNALLKRDQLAGYELRERFYEIGSPHGIVETNDYILRHSVRKDGLP